MPHARAMLIEITFPVLAKVTKASKVTAFYGICMTMGTQDQLGERKPSLRSKMLECHRDQSLGQSSVSYKNELDIVKYMDFLL